MTAIILLFAATILAPFGGLLIGWWLTRESDKRERRTRHGWF